MNKVFVLSLAGGVLLAGCGGGAGGSSSGGSSSTSSVQVSIDAMTSVPVVNGSSTQGTLYVHNYGTSTASGVNFNLGSATLKTKLKSALAKIGLNLGGYEDSQGFILINPERCVSIPAGGSCAVNFSTPSMTLGNLGNSLVSLSYNSGNGTQSTSQVVNYNYVSLAALSGVNFTGGLNVTGTQGSTQHVVGYAYGGGISGTSYKNVNLNSTNPTTTISNGFINGQEVVAGQVIAVEFAVALQGNKTSSVNVTPAWGGSQLQSSKLQSHALNAVSVGSGVPLSMTLTPSQNTVNYIFGNVPILAAPTGTTAESISVVNNGNADGSGGLTATATPGSGLTIDDTECRSTALLSNGRNSCEIKFSTNSYIPGSAVVQYKSGATVVGSQTVVWTNDQPYPAVYVTPTPAGTTSVNPLSFGKGQPSGAIVFTITNVGKAPLTGVTYPVTNTGSATWAEASRTCTTTIGVGPSSSCNITGNLTGADDGTGQLYVKAVGSFNSTNYSFVSLPVNYTVTATPSLSITPNTSSLTLLANNTDIKTQVYTVKNNGNDPALFTAVNLLTPGSAALKPVITGSGAGVCANNTTLAENAECTVTVTYGPAAVNLSANESGVATLDIDYHGGTPDTPRNAEATLNYNLVGNDSYVQESMTATGLTGSGTSGAPYVGNANLNPMKITLTYTNPSVNYSMSNFNLNTNNLPYGLIIDTSNSTCATGADKMNIESNGGFCRLVLSLDRAQLATVSGSVVLDFTSPKATWTTPLGFYSQAGSMVDLNYAQPSVVFVLSQNNGSFESTILSITGSNLDKGANPLPVSVGGVSHWLESSPVNPSSNCTVNPSTYAVSCNLTVASNVESVTYVMPNYLQTGESADIPLMFSTSTSAYGFLSPTYTFINYLAP